MKAWLRCILLTISNWQVGYLIVDHEETPELLQVNFMEIRSMVIVAMTNDQ